MPTSPGRAEDTSPAPSMPTSVRVAVVLMAVLAGLLLLNAVLTWWGREGVARAIAGASADLTRAEAERFVVLWLVPYLVLGIILALSAWFLPRRQAWARWVGLAATALLALLTVVSAIAAGGVSAGSLLLLVLSIGAIASLVARGTKAWVPRLRADL